MLPLFLKSKAYFTSAQRKNVSRFIYELKLLSRLNLLKKRLKPLIQCRLDPRQKGEKIYELVYSIRYPTITSVKRKFDKAANELRKLTGCKFSPPTNFEGNNIRISFEVSSIDELESTMKKLIKKRSIIKKLFLSLKGL